MSASFGDSHDLESHGKKRQTATFLIFAVLSKMQKQTRALRASNLGVNLID